MIRYENLTVSYNNSAVIGGLSLHVAPGEHIALMGPSGCGKTTLMNLAAGLIRPTYGSVSVAAGRISYAFQEPRLFPWSTAVQNVNTVLSDRRETLSQAGKWLELVKLGDAADKYPRELSGGMRQRVSLARALAYDGELFLLDEPLKGLDEALRLEMLSLLRERTAEKTLVLATHDQTEAEALADTIYHYRDGAFVRA